jgi:hypothetical protein
MNSVSVANNGTKEGASTYGCRRCDDNGRRDERDDCRELHDIDRRVLSCFLEKKGWWQGSRGIVVELCTSRRIEKGIDRASPMFRGTTNKTLVFTASFYIHTEQEDSTQRQEPRSFLNTRNATLSVNLKLQPRYCSAIPVVTSHATSRYRSSPSHSINCSRLHPGPVPRARNPRGKAVHNRLTDCNLCQAKHGSGTC